VVRVAVLAHHGLRQRLEHGDELADPVAQAHDHLAGGEVGGVLDLLAQGAARLGDARGPARGWLVGRLTEPGAGATARGRQSEGRVPTIDTKLTISPG
jgi:hypothetical protein